MLDGRLKHTKTRNQRRKSFLGVTISSASADLIGSGFEWGEWALRFLPAKDSSRLDRFCVDSPSRGGKENRGDARTALAEEGNEQGDMAFGSAASGVEFPPSFVVDNGRGKARWSFLITAGKRL